MTPANFAPIYVCFYPSLAEIARRHGYSLAVHGSLARDMDLVAIPWEAEVSEPIAVLEEICAMHKIELKNATGVVKKHGRLCYGLVFYFGESYIDISFMPRSQDQRLPEGPIPIKDSRPYLGS